MCTACYFNILLSLHGSIVHISPCPVYGISLLFLDLDGLLSVFPFHLWRDDVRRQQQQQRWKWLETGTCVSA